jgi:hypothetical protein
MTKINYSPLFVAAVADLTTSSVLCMARSERNFAIVNVLRREGLQNAGVAIKLFPRSRWLCHENRLWPLSIWKSQF